MILDGDAIHNYGARTSFFFLVDSSSLIGAVRVSNKSLLTRELLLEEVLLICILVDLIFSSRGPCALCVWQSFRNVEERSVRREAYQLSQFYF